MTNTPSLGISPHDLDIVRTILQQHIPEREVRAFGSRVSGTARHFSDLDLVVMGDKPLSLKITAALAEDFSDSSLSFKVDIVDWAAASPQFQGIILQNWAIVQPSMPR